MGKVTVKKGDITRMVVDAIVNAANVSLLGGGGVDGAIHDAAGPGLLKECQTLGGAKTGEAKITGGYLLPAKFVIHTPGPIYSCYGADEAASLLGSCYWESLKLAEENGCESIAFPCISTGVYGYPKKEAARIAVTSAIKFLHSGNGTVKEIIFVVFDDENLAIYSDLIGNLSS